MSRIYDVLSRANNKSHSIGKWVLLSPSFVGGSRYTYSHYQDALSIYREHGNPQYFLSFTCNVNWREIRRYMAYHNQTNTHSKANIISRIFHVTVKALITFMKEDKTFGDVIACKYL